MDLPELTPDGKDVEREIKNLCPWLPDPKICDCGAYTDADRQYVAEQAIYVDVWDCPECEKRYYRDRV